MEITGSQAGRWTGAVLPPAATLVPTVQFVIPVGAVAVAAWLLGGGSGGVGFVLGVVTVSSSAVGAVRLAETAAVGVLAVVFAAIAVALPDDPSVAAAGVALAALCSAPLDQRSNGAGVMLPVLVAVLVVGSGSAATTAAWVLVGATLMTALPRLLNLRRPVPSVSPSVAWRHAVVTAVVAGLLTWAVMRWEVPHGYWAVAAVCVVLRPVAAETARAAIDRVSGTVAGALLAGLIAVLLPAWAAVVAAVVCTLLMVGWLIAADQRRYVAFLTPVVVLAAAAGRTPVFDLAAERVVLSAIGAVVAAGIAVGLRRYERERSPQR